jgi:hypothetical protein
MPGAITTTDSLNRLLEKFGVKFESDLLILPPNDVAAQMIGQNNAVVTGFDDINPVTKDFARQSGVALVMHNSRSVDEVKDNPNKLKVTLTGKTQDKIIKVRNVHSAADLENLTEDRWEMGAFPVIAVANGKTQAPATATADNTKPDVNAKTDAPKDSVSTSRETRLIAVGSVDFAANSGAQAAEHRDMFMNMVNYLMQDEDFISIRPKDPTKSSLDIASGRSQLTLLVLAFIYPFFFLGAGTFAWLKRRRA